MALPLGNMITALEAKDLLDAAKATQTLKLQLHSLILQVAEGITQTSMNVPKAISASAVPIIEQEGYTVTREVLVAGPYDLLTVDWSSPT